jgi:hypothetical protein
VYWYTNALAEKVAPDDEHLAPGDHRVVDGGPQEAGAQQAVGHVALGVLVSEVETLHE